MRIGICQVPYKSYAWLPPAPTKASWIALKSIGIRDVRLQFDPAIASSKPDAWNTEVFTRWFSTAIEAGMSVHVNIVSGVKSDTGKVLEPAPVHQTPLWLKEHVYKLVEDTNDLVASWGVGNEPGFGEWMKTDISQGGQVDYIKDVYFPHFVNPVVTAIHDADIMARVTGFEADSPEIQVRCMAAATHYDLRIDAETIHPYGDVGGGDYATMAKFSTNRHLEAIRPGRIKAYPKPWLVGEIDHQQLPGSNGVATAGQLHTLFDFVKNTSEDYPDVECIFLGTPNYFFTEKPLGWPFPLGTSWNTWTLPERQLSSTGQIFKNVAKLNGWA